MPEKAWPFVFLECLKILKKLEIVAYAEGFPTLMPQTESLPKISWCDLGHCSQAVVVIKLRRISSFYVLYVLIGIGLFWSVHVCMSMHYVYLYLYLLICICMYCKYGMYCMY